MAATEVETTRGAVVTPHEAATGAGLEMLMAGGNAVDAALAANAAQGVVAPETCGIGGDLFALVHRPGDDRPLALDSSGRAGSGVDAAELRATGAHSIPRRHPGAIPVPGCVDGWVTLSQRLGRLPLNQVLAPAIRLAEGGFAANPELAEAFTALRHELSTTPAAAPMYPGGLSPRAGDLIARPALAETLHRIADGGRQAFYGGPAGRAITEATGGAITLEDLERLQSDWVEPLGVEVWGSTAWTVPPSSQGYLGVGACRILELLGPPDQPDHPLTWHLMIEAYRVMAAGRDSMLSDRRHLRLDPAELLSPERLAARAAAVDPHRAVPRAGPVKAAGGTAYMCAVDSDDLGVSLIQSNFQGIGSGVGAGDAGFLLHDRGLGFTLEQGHPNELAPGKRPLHTLSPTIWTEDGDLRMVLGTRGGHVQPQLILQVATAILGWGLHPAAAQDRPRWTGAIPSRSASQSEVAVEPGVPEGVITGLEDRGHRVTRTSRPQPGWGPVSAIVVEREGRRRAAADPRVSTALAGITGP